MKDFLCSHAYDAFSQSQSSYCQFGFQMQRLGILEFKELPIIYVERLEVRLFVRSLTSSLPNNLTLNERAGNDSAVQRYQYYIVQGNTGRS